MFETIVRAFVSLIDGVMGIFRIGHAAEKHLSEGSRVGRSRMDEEALKSQEGLLHSWWLVSFLLLLFSGGVGLAIWQVFAR